MTNEELLDQYAIQAMNAFIQKLGSNSLGSIAMDSFYMAERMLETREAVFHRRKQEEERQRQYATADLHKLNLPVRYHRCLTAEDIYTIERLQEWTDRELRKIPNLGMKGLKLIKEAMAAHGLKLKGQE